jgi:hypothetical protein
LDCIARHMPVIGQAAWDAVVSSFNLLKDDGRPERDKGSVQRKFSELHQRCTPTGNPNIPPEVKRAKAINKEIMDQSEVIDAEAMDELGSLASDEPEVAPPSDTAANPSGLSVSTATASVATSRKQRRDAKARKTTDTADFIQVLIQSEKAASERAERNLKMMCGFMGNCMQAFAVAHGVQLQQPPSLYLAEDDDADNTSLSSIDSDDSPPTVRAKKKQRKKKNTARKARKKKRKSQEKANAKHGDSSSDNDSDVERFESCCRSYGINILFDV